MRAFRLGHRLVMVGLGVVFARVARLGFELLIALLLRGVVVRVGFFFADLYSVSAFAGPTNSERIR
ncbi:MAG: hypothetical protein ACJ8KO_11760 [Sulfurifustaceae bacterium]